MANRDQIHITVTVCDLKTDAVVAEHRVNYSSNGGKAFLERTQIWAWNNGKYVETALDTEATPA